MAKPFVVLSPEVDPNRQNLDVIAAVSGVCQDNARMRVRIQQLEEINGELTKRLEGAKPRKKRSLTPPK